MKTLILILLDESGSMSSQRREVVAGFNYFIDSQKQIKEDEASVIFLKFSTTVTKVLDCVRIANVPKLDFHPHSCTALYDAIQEGVELAEKDEHLFDRMICVIFTDGKDNSSRKFDSAGVGKLVKKKEGQGNWTFMYIGQDPDVWVKLTGMSAQNSAAYNYDTQGQNFDNAGAGLTKFRNQSQCQMSNVLQVGSTPRSPSKSKPKSKTGAAAAAHRTRSTLKTNRGRFLPLRRSVRLIQKTIRKSRRMK